jgi:lysozyme
MADDRSGKGEKMTMTTSANGRKFIEQWEGAALTAYDDGTGTLTIGYGHTTAAGLPRVYAGMTITSDEADAILSSDLASVEADVNHHVTGTIDQNQFDALVSFDYNTGALDRSNVLAAVNAGNFGAVPGCLNMWDHATVNGQLVVMSGLLRRRQAEGVLFNTGTVTGP